MKKIRINVTLSEEVKEWCQSEAEKVGVSMSGFVAMVVSQWKEQKEVASVLPDMLERLKKIEDEASDK